MYLRLVRERVYIGPGSALWPDKPSPVLRLRLCVVADGVGITASTSVDAGEVVRERGETSGVACAPGTFVEPARDVAEPVDGF